MPTFTEKKDKAKRKFPIWESLYWIAMSTALGSALFAVVGNVRDNLLFGIVVSLSLVVTAGMSFMWGWLVCKSHAISGDWESLYSIRPLNAALMVILDDFIRAYPNGDIVGVWRKHRKVLEKIQRYTWSDRS